SPGSTTTAPGTKVVVPITLSLRSGVSLDSVAFGFRLAPNLGSLAVAGPLTFQVDPLLPSPSLVDNGAGPNLISVSFLNLQTPVSGTVHLGDVTTTIPFTATP